MRKSYEVDNMIYTLEGEPYGSTLDYSIVNSQTNKNIGLCSLNPYQRSLLCMCHENFNQGDNADLQENGIIILT